eukprot:1662479-Prorocentrum_lima.AAC.1
MGVIIIGRIQKIRLAHFQSPGLGRVDRGKDAHHLLVEGLGLFRPWIPSAHAQTHSELQVVVQLPFCRTRP